MGVPDVKTPPQPLPTRGRDLQCGTLRVKIERKNRRLAFSPLEGEMPGRAEGGEPNPLRPETQA